jgi:hypothetical protein
VARRKDCNCACHTAPNVVIHVHPCCGPGSEGWPNVTVPDRDPYKALSLFGNDKETKPAGPINLPVRSLEPVTVHYRLLR